ncbi:MAG: hypothetical protein HYU56_02640 [Candidatus Aenigmarchaeota archaeon]|nr:hypothetical protein [Candidatus Aenigmarchaeota archaeon]
MTSTGKVAVVQRHAVLDAHSAANLKKILRRSLRNQEKTGYSQYIVLTYKPELLHGRDLLCHGTELERSGVELKPIEWTGLNPGTTFYASLDIGGPVNTRFILNADDFPVDEGAIIDTLYFMRGVLAERPVIIGQRKEAKLSAFEELNRRRQVHEMFMATLYPEAQIFNPLCIDASTAPAAYRVYGDRFSGFYGLNCGSQETQEILRKLKRAGEISDMHTTFCPEYLLGLLASEKGGIPLVYVPTCKNYGSRRSENEVDRMINYSSKQMFRTETGDKLRAHVERPETAVTIAKFYDRHEVRHVRKLMLD